MYPRGAYRPTSENTETKGTADAHRDDEPSMIRTTSSPPADIANAIGANNSAAAIPSGATAPADGLPRRSARLVNRHTNGHFHAHEDEVDSGATTATAVSVDG